MVTEKQSRRAMMEALPGRSYDSIKCAIDVIRAPPPTQDQRLVRQLWRSDQDLELKRLSSQGMPFTQIAKKVGRSARAVRLRYHALFGRFRGPPCTLWTPEEDQTLRTLRTAGTPFSLIAEQLPGRTKSAVRARYYLLQRMDETSEETGMG